MNKPPYRDKVSSIEGEVFVKMVKSPSIVKMMKSPMEKSPSICKNGDFFWTFFFFSGGKVFYGKIVKTCQKRCITFLKLKLIAAFYIKMLCFRKISFRKNSHSVRLLL